MRTNFSPTLEAARRHGASAAPFKAQPAAPAVTEPKYCAWPRPGPAPAARGGIWRALQEIQLRHA